MTRLTVPDWSVLPQDPIKQAAIQTAIGVSGGGGSSNPTFTGNVGVPTRTAGDSTDNAASTKFINDANLLKSANVIPTYRPQLAKWFAGGVSGKKIIMCGDSTTDGAASGGGLYTRLTYYTTSGNGNQSAPLAGVTVVDYGTNGASAQVFNSDGITKGLTSAIAQAGDLYVICFGLNDVRQGLCDLPTLKARLTTMVTAIRAALPNACIVLRKPHNILLTDPTSAGTVTPLASAAAYNAIINRAYEDLANLWPDVVMYDVNQYIFGRGQLNTNPPFMADILHATTAGQSLEIDPLVGEFIGMKPQVYLDQKTVALYNTTYFQTPWTYEPMVLTDTKRFTFLGEGAVTQDVTTSTGFYRITFPMREQLSYATGDIVWVDGIDPFVTTSSGSNSGNSVTGFTQWGVSPPVNLTGGRRVRVFRDRYRGSMEIALRLNSPDVFKYAIPFTSGTASANTIDINFDISYLPAFLKINASDVLIVPGQSNVTLSSSTYALKSLSGGGNLVTATITKTSGFSTSYSSLAGYIFGTTHQDTRTNVVDIIAATTGTISHASKLVRYTLGTGNDFTLRGASNSVVWPVDAYIDFIQMGAGQLQVVAGTGVTVNFPSGLGAKTRAQYSRIRATYTGSDTWQLSGDLGL